MSGDEEKKITAIFILEVMGRPKEHLIETLEDFSKQINSEKGVKIIQKKINEPKLIKDQKDLFTTFAEIEFEIKELSQLVILVFKYMPAHVEILKPEKLNLTNNQAGDLLNEITGRLHKYDELAKILQYQNQALEKKLKGSEKK